MKNFNEKYNPNYNGFFSMVQHIGDELNERKLRFDKADLLEMGFAAASGDRLEWVDKVGCDLECALGDSLRFEVKSQKFCLHTDIGTRKKKTGKIKLTNTLQRGENKTLDDTADYLIIIDTGNDKSFSVAIIDYSLVKREYTKEVPDGFECQVPTSELTFLSLPKDLSLQKLDAPSYREQKAKLQMEVVSAFVKQGE